MDDLLGEFVAETREMLSELTGQLIVWEQEPHRRDVLDAIFRFVHTVKGSSDFLGLPRLSMLADSVEEILNNARNGKIIPDAPAVTTILQSVDQIVQIVNSLETEGEAPGDEAALIAALDYHCERLTHPTESAEIWGAQADQHESAPETIISDATIAPKMELDIAETLLVGSKLADKTMPVSVALLEQVMEDIADLSQLQNAFSAGLKGYDFDYRTKAQLDQIRKLSDHLREQLSRMRALQIEKLLRPLERVVRDIGLELGKKAILKIETNGVEVDRDIVAAMREPIFHLVRNAIDHGIEKPDERLANGKPEQGIITIRTRQSGNQLVLEMKDDGRGIDLEKLKAKAVGSVLTEQDWNAMSEADKFGLIFMPGLSTADQVSRISGRGVGMDAVKNVMEGMGGAVDVRSIAGQGTTMTTTLPLTLSLLSVLNISAGNQTFGLPVNSIVEILPMHSRHVVQHDFAGKIVFEIRGEYLAQTSLSEQFGLTEKGVGFNDCELIIIQPPIGPKFVLLVDSLQDTEDLAIRPCAPAVAANGCFIGMAQCANGLPVLILDVAGVSPAEQVQEGDYAAIVKSQQNASQNIETEYEEQVSLLIFEDMYSRKMAIRTAIVDRTESVHPSDVIDIDGRQFVQIDDRIIPLVSRAPDAISHSFSLIIISNGRQDVAVPALTLFECGFVSGKRVVAKDAEYEFLLFCEGEAIAVLNAASMFEYDRTISVGQRPACYLAELEDQSWARNVLAPLLSVAGYSYSFDKTNKPDNAITFVGEGHGDTEAEARERYVIVTESGSTAKVRDEQLSAVKFDQAAIVGLLDKLAGAA